MPAIDGVFWSRLFQIMLVNLILSGDNAVIIAMAVNKLDPKQKRWGIILGSGLAVVLRVILTGFAVMLLTIPFLKVVGGLLILWIAVKLFAEGHEENVEAAGSLKAAVWTILVADLVMRIDNVLAVAGAAGGGMILIMIGLVTSIPIVIFGSTILSALMQRFPIIITIGAAILGKVGGEMIITDAFIQKTFHWAHSKPVEYGVQIFFAIAVIVVGKLVMKKGGEKTHEAEASEGKE
jgi:YjbE family integral membrane protein